MRWHKQRSQRGVPVCVGVWSVSMVSNAWSAITWNVVPSLYRVIGKPQSSGAPKLCRGLVVLEAGVAKGGHPCKTGIHYAAQ